MANTFHNFEDQEIKRRGLMLVISAPSGAGKTTLCKKLLQVDPHIHFSVSATTRAKRASEVNGVDYIFTAVDEFNLMAKNNEFLEYAEICGNFYGTPFKNANEQIARGEDVLFEIDWQGHRQLISRARNDVVSVFILPPSKEELSRRINGRGQDSDDIINERLEKSNWDICHWQEYDYIIVNRDIETSFTKLQAILRAERLKKERRTGLADFVNDLIKQDVKSK